MATNNKQQTPSGWSINCVGYYGSISNANVLGVSRLASADAKMCGDIAVEVSATSHDDKKSTCKCKLSDVKKYLETVCSAHVVCRVLVDGGSKNLNRSIYTPWTLYMTSVGMAGRPQDDQKYAVVTYDALPIFGLKGAGFNRWLRGVAQAIFDVPELWYGLVDVAPSEDTAHGLYYLDDGGYMGVPWERRMEASRWRRLVLEERRRQVRSIRWGTCLGPEILKRVPEDELTHAIECGRDMAVIGKGPKAIRLKNRGLLITASEHARTMQRVYKDSTSTDPEHMLITMLSVTLRRHGLLM